MDLKSLEKKAYKIRLDALTAMHKAALRYVGSAMSVVEILTVLYYGELMGKPILKFNPRMPGTLDQDYVVLSKGEAAPVLYAILADLGFFDKSELNFMGKVNGLLQARPYSKIPGVNFSTISHGHGLSQALGTALAIKMDRQNNRVFCVLGDSELQEGQIWEAAMAASHYKLNNLIAFVDNNKIQADGNVCAVMNIDPIQAKFESFGWKVYQITNGHDFDQLLDSLARAFTSNRQPVLIWCRTVCGKGIDFAEGKLEYQNAKLSENEISLITSKYKELYDL